MRSISPSSFMANQKAAGMRARTSPMFSLTCAILLVLSAVLTTPGTDMPNWTQAAAGATACLAHKAWNLPRHANSS